jgi:hypothetical protein
LDLSSYFQGLCVSRLQIRKNSEKKKVRGRYGLIVLIAIMLPSACVTNYPFDVMDPPWIPEDGDNSSAVEIDESLLPDERDEFPVFFSSDDRPRIDGDFSEWQGLDGALTRRPVYGGNHDPSDAEGFFVLRTDGVRLYIYARVSDDVPNANSLSGSLAWRGDTVEVFFGDVTARHTGYLEGDNQIRLVGRDLEGPLTDIVVNQATLNPTAGLAAHTVFHEKGYEVEASIPLNLLGIDGLSPGQRVRGDFQVNDADETERDRLVHWFSPEDVGYFDPSSWGNGRVVELPEERKENPIEL